MLFRVVTFIAFALLAGCATPPSSETSYNLGVNAFRAKDYLAAQGHWKKAVDEGEPSAMNNLGYLLFYGLGGNQDRAQAIDLWKKAAYASHAESQWHLGNAFERGEGVTQSDEEAYAWYRCSIANAEAALPTDESEAEVLKDANKSLARLLSHLPAELFSTAEVLAKQYIAKYAKHKAGV